ncbi:hypothetical protein BDV28DRAFT_149509 [Aspergillus coremiiformis]|uniref:Uncharacterized protein n=1 Tax=Aspergillus coremiiformis TaxID=138285 RepID=A0A5N6Z5K5_9EURO|nr:hypothetical protein BDV28DRAFT_149509 [Aspergillus coremiiformis]
MSDLSHQKPKGFDIIQATYSMLATPAFEWTSSHANLRHRQTTNHRLHPWRRIGNMSPRRLNIPPTLTKNTGSRRVTVHGPVAPVLHTPESVVTDLLSSSTYPSIVSSDASPARWGIVFAAIEHGHLGRMYGRQIEGPPRREPVYPTKMIEQPGMCIPRGGIAVMHGRQDTVIP